MNKDDGKEQQTPPQQEKKSHEMQMRDFAGKLNDILSEGYSLPAVLQVLESAVFEFRMNLYMQQMEMMERERMSQKRLEIPTMTIPTNKRK